EPCTITERMMRTMLAGLVACMLAGCATPAIADGRDGFVDAASVAPGLVVDMRYVGSENFVGRPVAGYEAPVCLLTKEAGAALGRVQAKLKPFGLGLKVFDCYRPQRAVADFVAWAKDPADQIRKAIQYPNV